MREAPPIPSPDPAGAGGELRRELAKLDRQLTGLISQHSELLSERAELARSLEHHRAELANAQAEIEALRRTSEGLRRTSEALSRAWRWQLLVRGHELAAARGLTETVQAELARVEHRLSVRAGQLQALRASRSFRLATRLSAMLHPGRALRPRTRQRTSEPPLGD